MKARFVVIAVIVVLLAAGAYLVYDMHTPPPDLVSTSIPAPVPPSATTPPAPSSPSGLDETPYGNPHPDTMAQVMQVYDIRLGAADKSGNAILGCSYDAGCGTVCISLLTGTMSIPLASEYPPSGHDERVSFSHEYRLVLDQSESSEWISVQHIGGDSFMRIRLKVDVYTTGVRWSPRDDEFVFLDRVKDEYGDYDNYAIRICDPSSRRVKTIITDRREMSFMWVRPGVLAVNTFDKYAVPTLSLHGTDGRCLARLVTDKEFVKFVPKIYIPSANRLVYVAHRYFPGDLYPEELWAVEPGRKPVRLFPKKVRYQR